MRVNIIGAGLAGLSAALTLAKDGVECNLFSVQQSERAQSVMAEGGINAVLDTMNEDDKIEYHIKDTMDGGANLADPNAVDGLCRNAPDIVRELEQLGVPFSKNEKGIVQRSFGGQKKKRTAFVKSSTGKMLMTAMIDAVRQYEAQGLVYRYPHHRLEDLIVRDNECCGAVLSDFFTGDVYEFYGSVIMATGVPPTQLPLPLSAALSLPIWNLFSIIPPLSLYRANVSSSVRQQGEKAADFMSSAAAISGISWKKNIPS